MIVIDGGFDLALETVFEHQPHPSLIKDIGKIPPDDKEIWV
jgi:hypothetical protein